MAISLLQAAVLGVIGFTFLASLVLAWSLTAEYKKRGQRCFLFWGAGLWLFAIGTALELLFAVGIYSEFLISLYLFVVGVLVLSLSLGSLELAKSRKIKIAYWIFSAAATIFLLYTLLVSYIGDIITSYIVYGNLPALVALSSSLMTIPAAIVIVVMAYLGYRQRGARKLLYIVAGVVIVTIAGTLYIASVPELLYASEFIGILLLWLGFR